MSLERFCNEQVKGCRVSRCIKEVPSVCLWSLFDLIDAKSLFKSLKHLNYIVT